MHRQQMALVMHCCVQRSATNPGKFECAGSAAVLVLGAAGNVVLNSKFYEDTSGNILNEICECPCCRAVTAAVACKSAWQQRWREPYAALLAQ
jgi:hypothetical protein